MNIYKFDIPQGTKISKSFDINGFDFTGKSFKCDFKDTLIDKYVFGFNTNDNSLSINVVDSLNTTILLYKGAEKVKNYKKGIYEGYVCMFTNDSDIEPILKIIFNIV